MHCGRFQSALYNRKKPKSLHSSNNEKHILQLHQIRFRSVFTENFFQSKVMKILQKLKFIRQYIFKFFGFPIFFLLMWQFKTKNNLIDIQLDTLGYMFAFHHRLSH